MKRFFLIEEKKVNKSLQHLEFLPASEIVSLLENVNNWTTVEKLDGVAFAFGIDDDGKFYTSREGKGRDDKVYSAKEWETYSKSGAGNLFKLAHLAISGVQDEIESVLEKGDVVDVEIILGSQPNVVEYGLNGNSWIVLLNSFRPEKSKKIEDLMNKIGDQTTKVKANVVSSNDGETLETNVEEIIFGYHSPEKIQVSDVQVELLDKFKSFLAETNETVSELENVDQMTNEQVLEVSLNKIKKNVREVVKTEREFLKVLVMKKYIIPLKEEILNSVVRVRTPELQGKNVEEELGVEGVVAYSETDDFRFKIVDRDVFTKINRFFHKVRDDISGTIISSDPTSSLSSRGGIVGSNMLRIFDIMGYSDVKSTRKINEIVKKNLKDSRKETVEQLESLTSDIDFRPLASKLTAIFKDTINDLDEASSEFKKEWKEYSLDVPFHGETKTIKYTKEIYNRTLLAFAESRNRTDENLTKIADAKSKTDLVDILFDRQLKNHFGDDNDIQKES